MSIIQHQKAGLVFLITIWGVIQTAAYLYFDIQVPEDSVIYIRNAENLIHGDLPEGREILYLSYSSLIALPLLFNLAPVYTLLFHFIAAIFAIICIYKLTLELNGNNQTAFLAALLYVLWFKFQQWNLIVYTDSLFSSLVIINIFLIIKAHHLSRKVWVGLLILFTIFIRPPGIGLFVAFGVIGVLRIVKNQPLKVTYKIGFSIVLGFIALYSVNAVLAFFINSIIESYKIAEIIYPGIPLGVAAPESLTLPQKNYPPLIQLALVYLLNPIYMTKISLLKGVLFLAHIKPYYSFLHNLFIGAFLYPLYFFSIKGFRAIDLNPLTLFIVVFIIFQLLMVSLTSENWDGRFLLPILPFIFIFSALGLKNQFFKNI